VQVTAGHEPEPDPLGWLLGCVLIVGLVVGAGAAAVVFGLIHALRH
jgi:hypothetical protein